MDASGTVHTRLQRVAEVLHARVVAAGAEVRRMLAPVIAAWSRFAFERWERAQAFFSAHPDLAETDRFLDRWYSFGQV